MPPALFTALIVALAARVMWLRWLYATINSWFAGTLGLDLYWARPATIISLAVVLESLPYLLWFVIAGRKRRTALGVAAVGTLIMALLVSHVGRNTYFDRETGQPLRWYSERPDGTLFFSYSPGYDPLTGRKLTPYDTAAASAVEVPQVAPVQTSSVSSGTFADHAGTRGASPPAVTRGKGLRASASATPVANTVAIVIGQEWRADDADALHSALSQELASRGWAESVGQNASRYTLTVDGKVRDLEGFGDLPVASATVRWSLVDRVAGTPARSGAALDIRGTGVDALSARAEALTRSAHKIGTEVPSP